MSQKESKRIPRIFRDLVRQQKRFVDFLVSEENVPEKNRVSGKVIVERRNSASKPIPCRINEFKGPEINNN